MKKRSFHPKNTLHTPLILAPVGDFIALQAALDNGADEIYFGISGLNMRAGAKNFKLSDLSKIVKQCHNRNVKALLALNTIIYTRELSLVKKIVREAKIAGVDAIIAWDGAVINECIQQKIPMHLSTQNSISNYASLVHAKKTIPVLTRVVLARECSLADIKKIIKHIHKNKLDIEIEVFIHGAMCVSVSGRCFMSHELFGKSANRGECLQPCRRAYDVTLIDPEEGHTLELGRDYVMSPKDLCTIEFIDQLIDAGIDVFKIEGRNRNPEYVAGVVSQYRKVIDYYVMHHAAIKRDTHARQTFTAIKQSALKELEKVYHRGFSTGFYLGKPVGEFTKEYGSSATQTKQLVGYITNYYTKISVAVIKVESTPFKVGDTLIIQGKTTGSIECPIVGIQYNDSAITLATKGFEVSIKINQLVRKNDAVYVIKKKK